MAFQRMIIRPIPTHNRQKPTPSHPASSGSFQTPTVLYFHTRPLPAWTRQRQSRGPTSHRGSLRLMALADREDEVSMRAERLTGLLERQTAPPPTKWSLCFPSPALGPIHKGSGRHRLQSNGHAPGHKGKEETGNADVLAAVAAQRVTHECGQDAVRTALSAAASEQVLFSSTRLTQGHSWPAAGSTARCAAHSATMHLRLNSNTG